MGVPAKQTSHPRYCKKRRWPQSTGRQQSSLLLHMAMVFFCPAGSVETLEEAYPMPKRQVKYLDRGTNFCILLTLTLTWVGQLRKIQEKNSKPITPYPRRCGMHHRQRLLGEHPTLPCPNPAFALTQAALLSNEHALIREECVQGGENAYSVVGWTQVQPRRHYGGETRTAAADITLHEKNTMQP